MDKRRSIGNLGEDVAASFLKRRGYQILERNWRARFGELDIVVKDESCLVCVEVKSRSIRDCPNSPLWKQHICRRCHSFGRRPPPYLPTRWSHFDAITTKKQRRLRQLSDLYSRRHPGASLRIDIIAVDVCPLSMQGRVVGHVEGAL